MGGAAGHMSHPFDLPSVKTGADLINFFNDAVKYLSEDPGSVKIDGVNVSIKLVDTPTGKEFAVDRGSLKPIDVSGITADRVGERFPEGHGMRPAITELLAIFNAAIPKIEKELQELGMYDNPTIFLNTEYVKGQSNVLQYDEDFLAIHGLNQFYEKESSLPGKAVRPGAERPIDPRTNKPIKIPSREITYKDSTLKSLIEKVNPIAEEHGFKIYGSVPTEVLKTPDFNSTLNEDFTVVFNEEDRVTNPLKSWLASADNPKHVNIELADGRKMAALSKHVYLSILNGTPLTELVKNREDAKLAVDAAVFYHATRVLGNDIINGLTSPMGDVKHHEGIVLRDEKLFGPSPVKITGEFIVKGLETSFRENLNEEEGDRMTVALLPGSFRPPTKGHYGMVEHYLSNPSVDEVVVYISSPKEEKRTIAGRSIDPIQIWNQYVSGLENVHILKSDSPSPVTAVYEFISEAAPQNAVVILGCSEKGADPSRFQAYEKYKREDIDVESISCPVIRHDPKYINLLSSNEEILQNMPSFVDPDKSIEDIHASDMRYLAGLASDSNVAKELLGYFIPENVNKESIFSLLGVNKEPVQEKKTNMPLLSSLVEEVMEEKKKKTKVSKAGQERVSKKIEIFDKEGMDSDQAAAIAYSMEDRGELKKGGEHSVEEELDEMSSMAGGSVAGYAGKPPRKKKNKKNEGMVEQIIDYLLNTNKLEIS